MGSKAKEAVIKYIEIKKEKGKVNTNVVKLVKVG